jgi:hypothetical protein
VIHINLIRELEILELFRRTIYIFNNSVNFISVNITVYLQCTLMHEHHQEQVIKFFNSDLQPELNTNVFQIYS